MHKIQPKNYNTYGHKYNMSTKKTNYSNRICDTRTWRITNWIIIIIIIIII